MQQLILDDEIRVERDGGHGLLTFNRPAKMNTLTLRMIRLIRETLADWVQDESLQRITFAGEGERALCAGADVRRIRELKLQGEDYLQFFREEYPVIATVANFPKPITSLMSGVVMGGGLGFTAHTTHRKVSADARLAMPETTIGFSPDTGVLYELSRTPGHWGTHLALTATETSGATAPTLGLADEVRGEETTAAAPAWMQECYSATSTTEVIGRLEQHADPAAREAGRVLRTRSPFAVCVAHEAIQRAARMTSIDQVLEQDLRLVPHLIGGPDLTEGVRALLVDKDQRPRWTHGAIEEVTRDEVLACFA